MALSLGFGGPSREQNWAMQPQARRQAILQQNAALMAQPGHADSGPLTVSGVGTATPQQAEASRQMQANIDWNQVTPYYVDTGAIAPAAEHGTYDPNGPNARYSSRGNYAAANKISPSTPRDAAYYQARENYYNSLPVKQNAVHPFTQSEGSLASTPGTAGTLATPQTAAATTPRTGGEGHSVPVGATGSYTDPNAVHSTVTNPPVPGTGGEGHSVPVGATGSYTDPNAVHTTVTNPTGTPGTTGNTAILPNNPDPYGVNSTATSLGFGTLPTPIQTPQLSTAATVANPPAITAPTVTAAQGGFNDYNAMQQAMYENAYTPVEREISRQSGLADTRLNAQLAQAGIADSGTGINARQRQQTEYNQQRLAAATDASNQAAVTRYGLAYQQSMDNAKLRQETALANAGFDYNAQSENAKNLLTAGMANAGYQNQRDLAQANLYLQTMGLNSQNEQAARSQFLQWANLQEQDLARMDDFTLRETSMLYDAWLRQYAIFVSAGQIQYGKTDQSKSGLDISNAINFGA